jgi:hypothetical protein
MKTVPGDSEFSKRQASILRSQRLSRAFPRLILAGLIITIPSILLLGLHIFMICQGLFLAIIQLSPIWNPAKKVVDRIIDLPEGESLFPMVKRSLWWQIWYTLLSLPWLALTGFGVWLLIDKGFLGLNPIYMLLSH